MASYYETYKVHDLIKTYRSNPTMFNDDQLDELERLAADNQIEFKRTQSDFSLKRGLQQAQVNYQLKLVLLKVLPHLTLFLKNLAIQAKLYLDSLDTLLDLHLQY